MDSVASLQSAYSNGDWNKVRSEFTDRRLAESYAKAGNVLLPVFFRIDLPRGRPDRPLPEYFLKNAVPAKIGDDFGALTTADMISSVGSRVRALLNGVCHNGHSLILRPRFVAG